MNRHADAGLATNHGQAMPQREETDQAEPPQAALVLDNFTDFDFALSITQLSVELVAATLRLHLEMLDRTPFDNEASPATPATPGPGDAT